MIEAPPARRGIAGVLDLAGDLIEDAQDRLLLLSAELEEERRRQARLLVWAGVGFLAGLLALVFGSLALVSAFGERWRPLALAGLAFLYLLALGAAALALRRERARRPRPLGRLLAWAPLASQALRIARTLFA